MPPTNPTMPYRKTIGKSRKNGNGRKKPARANNNIPQPDPADVAALAYRIWIDRGQPIDDPDQDWHEAENRLRTELIEQHLQKL